MVLNWSLGVKLIVILGKGLSTFIDMTSARIRIMLYFHCNFNRFNGHVNLNALFYFSF